MSPECGTLFAKCTSTTTTKSPHLIVSHAHHNDQYIVNQLPVFQQNNRTQHIVNTEHPSRLLPEFVTEEEEEELLATFHWDETGGGKMKHRQVHN